MGMPANLAACGICLEAEEDKKKGLFGVQEEQGARWTGHGGGKPLRKHTEAPSILPPGCLSREVALKGRTSSMGDSCTSAAMAAGSQPAAPHTPLSTTETSAQEVRGSPRTRAHAPLQKMDVGRVCCLLWPRPRMLLMHPCMHARAPAAAYPALPARPSSTWNAGSGWCWALSWEVAELKGRETAFCISCPGTYEEWPDADATSSPQPGSPRTRGMRSRTAAGSY